MRHSDDLIDTQLKDETNKKLIDTLNRLSELNAEVELMTRRRRSSLKRDSSS